jgi:hypothetical protein
VIGQVHAHCWRSEENGNGDSGIDGVGKYVIETIDLYKYIPLINLRNL